MLIVVNDLSLPGGVTNFYRVIRNKYDKKDIKIKFFYQGIPKKHDEIIKDEYILKYVRDLLSFKQQLKNEKNIKIVQLNPSLYFVPVIRDALYIVLSKLYKKKVICVFHGWGREFEKRLMKSYILRMFFRTIYNRSNLFYVLSEEFKSFLKKIGITRTIKITKTTFDGDNYKVLRKRKGIFKMIYVGRFQKEKGVFTILKALHELKNNDRRFVIRFIGWYADEKTQQEFNEMIKAFKLDAYVDIKGYVSDDAKIAFLSESDIFVFPTFYPEGCPTVVMEAMAAGLFVVTTDTAALKEVVQDGVNGLIVKKDDYQSLKSCLEWCLDNREKVDELGEKNKRYAMDKYEAHVVVEDFYEEYKRLSSG